MKNLDNHIQDILSSKLGNLETEVSPHVWSGIESQLAQQAAAAGTTAVAKTIATKWLWAAAIATSVTVAIVAVVQLNKPDQSAVNPAVEQTITPAAQSADETSTNSAQLPATSSSEIASNTPHQTTSNSNTRPSSAGPEHEIVYITDENSLPTDPEPSTTGDYANGQTEQNHSGTPDHSNVSGTEDSNSNPSYDGSQEKATANFSPVVVNQKDLRFFFIPEFTQGAEYNWTMGDGTSYQSANPSHEFAEEGEYTIQLTVTDKSGKQYTDQHIVKAFKPVEVKIPTIFSPNGDGKNDVFEFEVISGQVEWNKIVILNNAGTVFESNGEELWRGIDKQGNPCAEGTYTYLVRGVDRNQAVIEKTGVVTLRR